MSHVRCRHDRSGKVREWAALLLLFAFVYGVLAFSRKLRASHSVIWRDIFCSCCLVFFISRAWYPCTPSGFLATLAYIRVASCTEYMRCYYDLRLSEGRCKLRSVKWPGWLDWSCYSCLTGILLFLFSSFFCPQDSSCIIMISWVFGRPVSSPSARLLSSCDQRVLLFILVCAEKQNEKRNEKGRH
jgi:hypothetical protein